MILKRIKIKNFRLLRDVDIDFGYLENERINIISGLRGTGKTTFFNAINWCLYGYELFPPHVKKKISICNLKTVNLASVGDIIEVKVELEFLDNEETLIFSRGSSFFKAENRLIPKHSLDRFELIIKDGQNYISNKYPDYFIEKWLPKEFFAFFPLYHMNFLSDELDTKRFVSSLNQTNLIENVYKHISTMEKKYIHQQKQNHSNISMINEKIYILEKKIKESEKDLETVQEGINLIKDKHSLVYQKSLLMEEYEKISQFDEYQKKIDFCRKMSSAAKLLMDGFSEEFRKKLQELTKEYFFKIYWEKNYFKDIIIHEDYQVGIIYNLGEEIRHFNLSGEERLIYGFCFLMALENVLGFDFPLFMEDVLSIFDNGMRSRFAEFLTHSLGDRQVILIIGMEMLDEIMNILPGSIGREYKIDYNYSDEGAESKVILKR